MKVAVITLGCRVNQAESDVIEGTLKDKGVTIVGLGDKPEFCIVNTCAVTGKSDYNSRQVIRRAARNGAKVIVTGCYSQLNTKEAGELPGVIKIIDISRKTDIIGLLSDSAENISYNSSVKSRPFLKVQDGCNFNCSYCAVPLARGSSRSIPADLLTDRVKSMVARGFKEIVLTGVHLGTYGHDLPESSGITGLLKELLLKTGIHRIRLSSLEIGEISDELLELLKDPRICRHLHLPLQSGSDRILGLMRRRYRSAFFEQRLELISARLGDIGLGTDIIVGFPGEGREEFLETLSMLQRLPLTYMHIFPYSPRPGTDAASMSGRPRGAEVRERTERLHILGREKKLSYMKKQIGIEQEIIFEDGLTDGKVSGTSSNYVKIQVAGECRSRGSLGIVRPTHIDNDVLAGDVIKYS